MSHVNGAFNLGYCYQNRIKIEKQISSNSQKRLNISNYKSIAINTNDKMNITEHNKGSNNTIVFNYKKMIKGIEIKKYKSKAFIDF